jgi:hypothetical protein
VFRVARQKRMEWNVLFFSLMHAWISAP